VIRRIVLIVVVGALAVLAFAIPREQAPVAADTLAGLPPSVVFRARAGDATPPFVERWDLTFSETPSAEQALTLHVGAVTDATAPGRLASGPGQAAALLARIADVFRERSPSAELPAVSELDLRLELLAERASIGRGDVGATVFAGAFVSDPPGDWRVFRMMVGENGPQCFLAISAGEQAAALLPRAVEDGPAIVARFRSLLGRGPAAS
jgi:hypothetical protein